MELVLPKMQNKKKLKIFIIAGEVSGDVLGAKIMKEMPDVEFVGIGGQNMVAAGLNSLFPMSDLAVMGIVEVLLHARTLTKRIDETVKEIITEKPDVVLTIDSPGFAKSVIKQIKKQPEGQSLIKKGLKFYHVVAPQVWAWREGRAKKYAKIFDRLYAFFDFEVPYFTKHGLDTVAVGHPISGGLVNSTVKRSKKSTEKIIALVPGSRMSEVKKLLPIFKNLAERLTSGGFVNYKFVIPTVETTAEYVKKYVENWSVKPELVPSDKRYELYRNTYIAVVASGTVSAELAMLHIPTIVVYKMNPITTWIGHLLIKVKWVSLVNILLNTSVYPECLGSDANVENILDHFQQLTIPSVRNKMIEKLKSADTLWLKPNGAPSALIADSIRKSFGK